MSSTPAPRSVCPARCAENSMRAPPAASVVCAVCFSALASRRAGEPPPPQPASPAAPARPVVSSAIVLDLGICPSLSARGGAEKGAQELGARPYVVTRAGAVRRVGVEHHVLFEYVPAVVARALEE